MPITRDYDDLTTGDGNDSGHRRSAPQVVVHGTEHVRAEDLVHRGERARPRSVRFDGDDSVVPDHDSPPRLRASCGHELLLPASESVAESSRRWSGPVLVARLRDQLVESIEDALVTQGLHPHTGRWIARECRLKGQTRAWYELGYYPHKILFLFASWRRGRDSNPRWTFTHTHFPGVLLRPLGHLSKKGALKRERSELEVTVPIAPRRTKALRPLLPSGPGGVDNVSSRGDRYGRHRLKPKENPNRFRGGMTYRRPTPDAGRGSRIRACGGTGNRLCFAPMGAERRSLFEPSSSRTRTRHVRQEPPFARLCGTRGNRCRSDRAGGRRCAGTPHWPAGRCR